jgi:hypothetical protein
MEVSGQLHAVAALLLGREPPAFIRLETEWVDAMVKRKNPITVPAGN